MFVADNGSVVVEEVSFESEIVRSFPCFSGDNMLSHLYLTTTETVDYYKFIISHNSFNIMKGKTPSDSNYQLRVVPSKGMSESSAVIDDDFDKDWDNFKDKADENNISSMSDWTVSMSAGKISMQYGNTVYSDVKVEKCDGKTYPCRLNAIFEQVSTAS